MEDLIREYIEALDSWRMYPYRAEKDRIFEAELDIREYFSYSKESMKDAFGKNYFSSIGD